MSQKRARLNPERTPNALYKPETDLVHRITMTVQYSLAFAVLVAEIVAFLILAIPALDAQKRRLVRFVARQPAFQPLKTLLLVIWFLILVLFLDAMNRAVLNPPGPNDVVKGKGTTGTVFDAQGAAAYNTAKRFYAQRNFYLTGITLLMAFVVARYYQLLVHALEIESQLRETRIRLGGVDALNREIDDFRLRVNDLDSQNKELSEKLRKAEKKIEDLTPKPATADEPPLESALEDETETGALGSGLRKRQ